MTTLRIAMIAACPFPANRGTPSRILRMSESLAALGHDIHVVTYHYGRRMETAGIRIHRIPFLPHQKFESGPSLAKLCLFDPLLAWKAYRIVKRFDIDIIHAHHFEGALAGLFARRFTGKTLVYDAHTTLMGEMHHYPFIQFKPLMKFLDKKVPLWAHHTIAVSDTISCFLESQGVRRDKIDVVPTGVQVETFRNANGDRIRGRHGLGERPVVMYTGSLAPFQGAGNLIPAMQEVVLQVPDAVLLIVGEWDETPPEALRLPNNLARNVRFINDTPFSEIPDYLDAAQVVVCPRTECPGIPQKLVNYMAAGKAIVSFEGAAKCLRHDDNGLLIRNGDTTAMAKAIISLIRHPDQRVRLGLKALASIEGHFDWHTLSLQLEQRYYQLLNGSVKARGPYSIPRLPQMP